MVETTVSVVDSRTLLTIFGTHDRHLERIRQALGVDVAAREDQVRISGEPHAVERATHVIERLRHLAHRDGEVRSEEVDRLLAEATGEQSSHAGDTIDVLEAGRKVQAKGPGQARFVRAMRQSELVFCVGPAGTGKTYLAVAMAVEALRLQRVRKIVLVRPAVEAGESLGYLPGDLHAKIHPYLRPLLDALRELLDYDQVKRYTEQDLVEVIPLAYMRGRTLNEAFIILDEAQNTTVAQMKMFLTRMGRGSKIVVVGDTTQIDLAATKRSGLVDAVERLSGIKGFARIEMQKGDIVRHRLVQAIVRAYEQEEQDRH